MEPGHFCVKVGWSAHRFRGIPWFLLVEMESADRFSFCSIKYAFL